MLGLDSADHTGDAPSLPHGFPGETPRWTTAVNCTGLVDFKIGARIPGPMARLLSVVVFLFCLLLLPCISIHIQQITLVFF